MIVMDCSAAVEIARDTVAGNAFQSLMVPDEIVIAPTHIRSEIRNTFWKYVHAGYMPKEEAIQGIVDAEDTIDEFEIDKKYEIEAFNQAVALDHPYYGMLYLVLARRNAATLFTLDKKLMDICREAKVDCVELIDF